MIMGGSGGFDGLIEVGNGGGYVMGVFLRLWVVPVGNKSKKCGEYVSNFQSQFSRIIYLMNLTLLCLISRMVL